MGSKDVRLCEVVRSVRSARISFSCALAVTVIWVFIVSSGDIRAQEVANPEEPLREVYEGPLVDGLREGFGKLTYRDGSVYEGEFANNLPSGNDETMVFADGRTYQGTFIAGLMQGYGTLEWPNGDVYVGTFNANAITGSGTFYWQESNVTYKGTMENGKLHGIGTMLWPDGRRYVGAFRQNERHGFGIYRTADGSRFRGFFEANQRHGDGVFEDSNGVKEFQRWNAGALVSKRPLEPVTRCQLAIDGQAWMFDSDECINGFAHGSGTAVRIDGLAYVNHGTFVVGRMVAGVIISLAGEDSQ